MSPDDAAAEALETWTAAQVEDRVALRWAPRQLERFAAAVRRSVEVAPAAARATRLVPVARRVLGASADTRVALCGDPALGRWTAGVEQALEAGEGAPALAPLLAMAPRLAVAVALREGADLDLPVVMGSAGVARVPADGRVLQGPPSRPLRVAVRRGRLDAPSRPPRRVGPFELADGTAEGGRMPGVRPLSGADLDGPARKLEEASAILAEGVPAWFEEIAALAPVLVAVAGEPEVSHSCSLPDVRGCIWLSTPHPPLVVAETLVHEASHSKFYLAEDAARFTDPDDPPRFHVPWRPDPRPLRTVLMGLHAWVRVLAWLETLADGPHRQPVAERRPILLRATRAVADALDEAQGLTPAGEALVGRLRAMLVLVGP